MSFVLHIIDHPHLGLPFVVVSVSGYLAGVQSFFTATTAVCATAFYLRMFYKEWKANRDGHPK